MIRASNDRDTVASVGVILTRNLPFTYSNKAIKTFRQALSLDEVCILYIAWIPFLNSYTLHQRRVRFQPDLYHRPAPNAAAASKDPQHATSIQGVDSGIQHAPRPGIFSRLFKGSPEYRAVGDTEEGDTTDVLEVWFSGCHSGQFAPFIQATVSGTH